MNLHKVINTMLKSYVLGKVLSFNYQDKKNHLASLLMFFFLIPVGILFLDVIEDTFKIKLTCKRQ